MADTIYSKTENNIEIKFNDSHYMEVRKKHSIKEFISMDDIFYSYYHAGNQIIDHPLLYKVVQCNETGTFYIVSKVLKTFYVGWYYAVQLDTVNNSSNILNLLNINSIAGKSFDFYTTYSITDITIDKFFEDKINTFGNHSEPAIDWFHQAQKFNNVVIDWFKNKKTIIR